MLACCVVAAPEAAHAYARPFTSAIRFDIGSIAPILLHGDPSTLSFDGTTSTMHFTVPAGAIAGTVVQSVPTIARPIVEVLVQGANQQGLFGVEPGPPRHVEGVMPLSGFAKVCLFFGCDAQPIANLTLPLSVVGREASAAATAAVNVTVRGAPWTTGPIGIPTPSGVGVVRGWQSRGGDGDFSLGLVTPVYISTNLPALSTVSGWATLLLTLLDAPEIPDCDDAGDSDGDGLVDLEDPGCTDEADASEHDAALACDDGLDGDGDGLIDWPGDAGCRRPQDPTETLDEPACDDGLDNDGDHRIDRADLGCDDPLDRSERSLAFACDDGIDQDGDGRVDFPDDLGCSASTDADEIRTGQLFRDACDDGVDEDGDGAIDAEDAGCESPSDRDERSDCADGQDDDGDGLVDYPADPGCSGPADPGEGDPTLPCDDGFDQDGDGRIDDDDPGCATRLDASERGTFACDDGIDDDGDGAIDWPADPGCVLPDDDDERRSDRYCDWSVLALRYPVALHCREPSDASTEIDCVNGLDDDGDGVVDTADPGCSSAADESEFDPFLPCDNARDDDLDGLADAGPDRDPGCTSRTDPSEQDDSLVCDDGLDNDGDGRRDANDAGCSDARDASEFGARPCENGLDDDGDGFVDARDDACLGSIYSVEALVCDNGLDDDGDGLADAADPGCDLRVDPSESVSGVPCDDGIDDDHDGLVDVADPGCATREDPDEKAPGIVCDDGIDQDGDGARDFPGDPGCETRDDPSEQSARLTCDDGLDGDRDGLVDFADPGCFGFFDESETNWRIACDDGWDDDGDGLADAARDPGCSGPLDTSERGAIACDDGLHEDGDGLLDYPADPGCTSPTDPSERSDAPCDDGIDGDGDGAGDGPDWGCVGPLDPSERSDVWWLGCDDGEDDDGDGQTDFPADLDCSSAAERDEAPPLAACANGIDDDGDGRVDAADAACDDASDDDEFVRIAGGPPYTIDASTSLPDASLALGPSDGSALRLVDGGVVGFRLVVDAGALTIDGGRVAGDLSLRGGETVIERGAIEGALDASDARATLRGGSPPDRIVAMSGARIRVEVEGVRGTHPVSAVAGTLDGRFADGTPFSIPFLRHAGATIELVPEPATAWLGIVACVSIAALSRRGRS